MALIVTAAVITLSWSLWQTADRASRSNAVLIAALLVLQLASGLSNVLLDWPLAAALLHSACAAALFGLLVSLWCRSRAIRVATPPLPPGPLVRRRA
jgi:cytochrome c oxidase assembly protein subunit 15